MVEEEVVEMEDKVLEVEEESVDQKVKSKFKEVQFQDLESYNYLIIFIVMICIQDLIKERKLIGNIGRNIEIEKICILENYEIFVKL